MQFKAQDRRLEGETVLRKCQLTQLYLLELLDEICKKHGLRYFLDFGTLLGAIRHGGAIPWDDDLDVSMPEDDYNRFLSIVPGELPTGVLLQIQKEKGIFCTPTSRLRDCKSLYLEECGTLNEPSGIFLDIYPLIKRRRVMGWIGRRLFRVRVLAACSEGGNRVAYDYTIFQMWRHAVMATAWRAVNICAMVCEKLLSIGRPYCWTRSSSIVTEFVQLEESDIFPLVTHQYEGTFFPVPRRAEKLLEIYYGDWRALPPEEERNPYAKMKLILPTEAPRMWWAVR